MIYFISDTHFSHKNIIKYSNRPFDSTKEMNECLIQNWNRTVQNTNDTVYFLGDFIFAQKNQPEKAMDIIKLLNGQIKFTHGNHDYIHYNALPYMYNVDFEVVPDLHTIHAYNTSYTLCHYPMRAWNKSHYGTIHLFGHVHGHIKDFENNLNSFDVGVDAIARRLAIANKRSIAKDDYRPISIVEVNNIIKEYRKDNPLDSERYKK